MAWGPRPPRANSCIARGDYTSHVRSYIIDGPYVYKLVVALSSVHPCMSVCVYGCVLVFCRSIQGQAPHLPLFTSLSFLSSRFGCTRGGQWEEEGEGGGWGVEGSTSILINEKECGILYRVLDARGRNARRYRQLARESWETWADGPIVGPGSDVEGIAEGPSFCIYAYIYT